MMEGPHDIKFDPEKAGKKSRLSGGSKNFEKILRKEKRGEEETFGKKERVREKEKEVKPKETFEEIVALPKEKELPEEKKVSLFDIAKGEESKPQEEVEEVPPDIPEDLAEESLSALFKGYGSKDKLAVLQKELLKKGEAEPKKESPSADIAPQKSQQPLNSPFSEKKPTERFIPESSDLSSVNPLSGSETPIAIQATQAKEPPAPVKTFLQEIVEEIMDKLAVVQSSGKTDTIITLKKEGLFKGANIVISSFESAKKEFNVSFENLSQVAKNLLDKQENQDALKLALEQKGYTIHIIRATTISEAMPVAGPPEEERGENERRREDRQREQDDESEG